MCSSAWTTASNQRNWVAWATPPICPHRSEGTHLPLFCSTTYISTPTHTLGSSKHKDALEMMGEPTEQRAFGDWSTGSAKATQLELLKLSIAPWSQRFSEALFPPAKPPNIGLLQFFGATRPAWQKY